MVSAIVVSDIIVESIGIGGGGGVVSTAVVSSIGSPVSPPPQAAITSSTDVANYLQVLLKDYKHEVFAVLFLNRSNKINHFQIISEGGITGTVADPRIILKKALEEDAVSIILCHNHPSGSLRPSEADELLTAKIKAAASYFDIRLLDHIIVSEDGYFSFADDGRM